MAFMFENLDVYQKAIEFADQVSGDLMSGTDFPVGVRLFGMEQANGLSTGMFN